METHCQGIFAVADVQLPGLMAVLTRTGAGSSSNKMFYSVSNVIQRGLSRSYRWIRFGSSLKADESAVLFPQCAFENPAGGWTIPLHAWIVELETGSLSRRIGQRAVMELLDLAGVVEETEVNELFKRRLDWFMADREINKRLKIKIEDQIHISPRSPPSGHVKFSAGYDGIAKAGSIIEYNLIGVHSQTVSGQVQLVPRHGISLISDIDDTIKISNVTNKKELIRGAFFEDYKAVDGMPALYLNLAAQGVCFHYVSSSPWQLYPALAPLLKKYFPFGSVSLRHFYIANRSFFDFFRHSVRYKTNTISDLLERYPNRNFILVGDSGEQDPEIYCEIAGRYKDRIKAILIRQVPDASDDQPDGECRYHSEEDRWNGLVQELPSQTVFRVFSHASEVADLADSMIRDLQIENHHERM